MFNDVGPHSSRLKGKDTKENGVFPAAGSSGGDNLVVPQVVVKTVVYGRYVFTAIYTGGVCGEGAGVFDQSGMG